jgi:hypothetical protein
MNSKDAKAVAKWFDRQTPEDQRTIALNAIERLIETGEARWRDDVPGEGLRETLYWESCGESLVIPF